MTDFARRKIQVAGDGVRLHVVQAGNGPPIILLHGFPENSHSWHHQVPALARAGFQVWAPDLRGYHFSDRPPTCSAYHLDRLVADVAALVRATGAPRVHLVGHDWGGIVAWTFASRHPELLHRLAILNAPHPLIYRHTMNLRQLMRSWYVFFFQLPRLPEFLLSCFDFFLVRQMFRRFPYRTGAFTESDIQIYIDGLAKPHALKAALDFYRANFRTLSSPPAVAQIHSPVLVIWGEHDPALGVQQLDGLEKIAPAVRIHRVPDAGHWIQNEAPEEVNNALIAFLSETHEP